MLNRPELALWGQLCRWVWDSLKIAPGGRLLVKLVSGSPGWRSSQRERQGRLSGSVSCSQQTSLTSAVHMFQLFNVWIDGEHSGKVNFSLPTVSLLSHLQILHLTFNAILPNCPALYPQSLNFASACLYRINLFSPPPHSCAQGGPGTSMCGTADFGGSFSSAAGR